MNMFVAAAGPRRDASLPGDVQSLLHDVGLRSRPSVAIPCDWTDFYSGGHAGYATARFDCCQRSSVKFPTHSHRFSKLLSTGHISRAPR